MLPLAMIYPKKEQAGLAQHWWLLDPTPGDLSVSQAGRPVFELKLEGIEAWCAKHFLGYIRTAGAMPHQFVCGRRICISQLLPTQFSKTCVVDWVSLYISLGKTFI